MKALLILATLFLGCTEIAVSQSATWEDTQTDSYITLYIQDSDTLVKGVMWKSDKPISGTNVPKVDFCNWLVTEFHADTLRLTQITEQAANIDSAIAKLNRDKARLTEEYLWRTDYKNLLIRTYQGVKSYGIDCLEEFTQ